MHVDASSKCGKKLLKSPSAKDSHEHPLVSVVTIVFNGRKELEPTILSTLNQSYKTFEYIIIDGGSTDGTLDIIHNYHRSIDYWVSEADQGIYDAMNKGLSISRGKWIYYLNCGDTFASPDVLEKASGVLASATAPIVAGFVLVDSANPSISRYPLPPTAKQSARNLFKRRFCHQALFTSRQACLAHNGFDLNFPIFADFDLFWKIISAGGRIDYIDLDIARFDLNGISSNHRKSLILYRESERLFAKAKEGRSLLGYWAGAARSLAYQFKCALVGKLFR